METLRPDLAVVGPAGADMMAEDFQEIFDGLVREPRARVSGGFVHRASGRDHEAVPSCGSASRSG